MTPSSTGPKANYAATDLIVQAAAGTVDICGPVDRPPLRTAGITAWAHAGAEAAGGTLIRPIWSTGAIPAPAIAGVIAWGWIMV